MAIKLKKYKDNKVMKKENKNYLLSAIVFTLLIVCSITMVGLYTKIDKKVKDEAFNGYEFYSLLYNENLNLYIDIMKQNDDKISDEDILIKNVDRGIVEKYYREYYEDYYSDPYEYYDSEISEENGTVSSTKTIKESVGEEDNSNNTDEEMYNAYINGILDETLYAIDESSGLDLNYMVIKDNKVLSEGENSISKYVTLREDGNLDYNSYTLKSKYEWYIIMSYDSEGKCTISEVYRSDKSDAQNMINSFNISGVIGGTYEGIEFNEIKDTTFIYGADKDFFNSNNSYYNHIYLNDKYVFNIMIYVMIIGSILALIALIIPYKYEKDIVVVKSLSRVPLEIKVIGLPLTLIGGVFMSTYLVRATCGNYFDEALSYIDITGKGADIIITIANILYWTIGFGLVFFTAYSIKKIFKDGIKNSLKDNTIVYFVFRFIKKLTKKIAQYVSKVDLRDKSNKKLLVLIGLNFLLLSVICMLWFFGIGALIIYSVVLFFIAKKYMDNIKEKYKKLLCATNKIAQGKLDVTIEEDLGIFEPFKEELDKIQKGFKKAVDEEVKSQRMKTELISNVSHDLKTPLTSIITYVDLLKQENITDEDRNKYIDTIDRKSQRLKKLIEDLFEMSKASSGNIKLNLMKVDIVSLMQQAQFELSDKISESSLEFRNNYPENKVILELDSEKTYRIFENLLINITKYSMKNSRVYIDIKDEEESVEITFRNISENEINFSINEIVERFVRGDKSRNTEGSGLGLSIAKSFVELQGGEFNIDIDGDLFKVTIRFKK